MPVLNSSTYKAPLFLKNNHIHTIYAALFRTVEDLDWQRERIEMSDGDFIDLDWSKKGASRLLIVLHGLEGNARRPYVQSLIKLANSENWDGMGLNFRSCSGEINRLLRTYHSGVSDDLDTVIQYVLKKYQYEEIVLAGFSLGGNVMLKYIGEQGSQIPSQVKAAVGVSVPVDLVDGSQELAKWFNKLYVNNFLESLKAKAKAKRVSYPNAPIDWEAVSSSSNFLEFDGNYTAPAHGFESAVDYWSKCSSILVLNDIRIPTLLVNAMDDSFLGKKCYPESIAKSNNYFHLETPTNGGHVGFVDFENPGFTWTDRRILQFLEKGY